MTMRERRRRYQRRLYAYKVREFLSSHPDCERCKREAHDVHHRCGRGKNLMREETWSAVCRECHEWIHQNPKEARRKGWKGRPPKGGFDLSIFLLSELSEPAKFRIGNNSLALIERQPVNRRVTPRRPWRTTARNVRPRQPEQSEPSETRHFVRYRLDSQAPVRGQSILRLEVFHRFSPLPTV